MNDSILEDVGAIVLCGGQSRRMGRPKAWLPFGPEEVLLQRVVRLVGQVASAVVVVAAPGQDVPNLPCEVTVMRDPIADRGPLQGLAAGLAGLPSHVDYAYATATDAPFLRPEWVGLLREQIEGFDIALPFVGGYHHPLAALYRRAGVERPIAEMLAADRLRPASLIDAVRTVILEESTLRQVDPDLGTIRNLNTIDDYEGALLEGRAVGLLP